MSSFTVCIFHPFCLSIPGPLHSPAHTPQRLHWRAFPEIYFTSFQDFSERNLQALSIHTRSSAKQQDLLFITHFHFWTTQLQLLFRRSRIRIMQTGLCQCLRGQCAPLHVICFKISQILKWWITKVPLNDFVVFKSQNPSLSSFSQIFFYFPYSTRTFLTVGKRSLCRSSQTCTLPKKKQKTVFSTVHLALNILWHL